MKGIRNPEQLKEVIQIALTSEDNSDAIWAIHKYKWYNWYQNIHIKQGTPEDEENTKIFKELEEKYPDIHKKVEKNIDYEIEKLKQ